MSIAALDVISNAMKELGINYSFIRWNGKPKYPYFTGEYQEIPPLNEDGMLETTFILNGFTRRTWLELEEEKGKIENYFPKVGGKTVITDSGSAVAVFYLNSFPIPVEETELKKIQINLLVKEWSE